MQDDSRANMMDHLELKRHADDYDWTNACSPNVVPELWLSIKGWFVECPRCLLRDEWISPIREGLFLCCHPRCWNIVPWRTNDGLDAAGVTDVQRAGDIVAVEHSAALARANVRNESEEQIAKWRNTDRHGIRHQRRRTWGRPSRDGSDIPYFLCWASAGASEQYARPYAFPPWEPTSQWSKPVYQWDAFPLEFGAAFKTLSKFWTPDFMLRSVEYYMLVWTCVHDCIKRDAGLWKLPTVRHYFHNVTRKGQ
jgi:hypothetical protein